MIINCRYWIAGKFRGDEFPMCDMTNVNSFMRDLHGRTRKRNLTPGQLVAAAMTATEGGDGSLFRIDWNGGGTADSYGYGTRSQFLAGFSVCIGLDTYFYFCSGQVPIQGRHVTCPCWDRRTRSYRINDTLQLIDMCMTWGAVAQGVSVQDHVIRLQGIYDAHPLWIFGNRDKIRDDRSYHDVFMSVSQSIEEVFTCRPQDTTAIIPFPGCESTDADANTATVSGIITSNPSETPVVG